MAATFESLLEKEFADVQKQREDILAKQAEIAEQLHAVEERFTRLKNAQAALQGTLHIGAPKEPKARAKGTRAPRGKRGEMREQIVALVGQFPNGLTAEGIYSELQADTPKAKQAIANLLVGMKKDNLIAQAVKRGPYTPGTHLKPDAPGA